MRSLIAGAVCAVLTVTAARATAQPPSETNALSQRYSAWMNAFRVRDGVTMDRMVEGVVGALDIGWPIMVRIEQ